MTTMLPIALAITAAIYLRGFVRIRRTRPALFTPLRAIAFGAGLVTVYLALFPPMDDLADEMLSAHMVEHLLLMSVVPPLLLLGLPVVPLLRGLPRSVLRVVSLVIRSRSLRVLMHFVTRPAPAWVAMNGALLLWHVPAAYDLALEHEPVHVLEHVCFLGTSMLFWAVVIQPWPMGARPHRWAILLYLLSADVINTALCAVLAFSDRTLYPYYLERANPFHIAPGQDQVLGAVIMWVAGSTVFLVPAAATTMRLLSPGFGRLEAPLTPEVRADAGGRRV